MIKAIFIDWGNVFATFFDDKEKKLNKILEPFGLDWKKFNNTWREFYLLMSVGKIKTDDEAENYVNKAFQKEIPVRELIKIIIESHFIPKEHIKIIKELKKNYKVAILSNNIQEWVECVLKNYGIEKLFDEIIISSAVGARKPDALIYYEGLKKFSVKPDEAVFVSDELSEDLVTASGIGMRTLWFKNRELAENEYDKKISEIHQPDGIINNFKEILSFTDFARKSKNNYAFIDSNNLNIGIQSQGWKLDFRRFRCYLEEKYRVDTAYMFIGYTLTNQDLYSSLQKAGYVLMFKPTIPDNDGKLKGNVDANLVIQAMIDYNKYDKAVIITSDGDFYCLAEYLYKNGKLEKIISPHTKTCSALLKKSAKERIVFMDNLRKKLEYKRKSTA